MLGAATSTVNSYSTPIKAFIVLLIFFCRLQYYDKLEQHLYKNGSEKKIMI